MWRRVFVRAPVGHVVNRHLNHVVKDPVEVSDMQQYRRERRCELCGKGYQRR